LNFPDVAGEHALTNLTFPAMPDVRSGLQTLVSEMISTMW